jgi:hypothetical protein
MGGMNSVAHTVYAAPLILIRALTAQPSQRSGCECGAWMAERFRPAAVWPALRRALWASACGCTLPSRSSSRSPPPERATPWSRAHIRRARTETQPHAHAPRGFAAAVSLRYGTEVRPKVRSFRYVCAAHSAGGATAAQSAATLDAFLDRVIEHRCAAESVARTARLLHEACGPVGTNAR